LRTEITVIIVIMIFALVTALGFSLHGEITLYDFLTEFLAGLFGVFLAFTLDRAINEQQKRKDKENLLTDLFTELTVIKRNLNGKGNLHFPDIWESAISSGQIRLLNSEQVRKLASIYHDVKGMEYEAIRCRDLAEKIRLEKTKGHTTYLNDLTFLWSGYSAVLRDREKKLLKKIEEILKEKWWIGLDSYASGEL
jgi:hypothetical protein